MRRLPPVVVWFALLVLALPLLHLSATVRPAAPLPEAWQLPDVLGDGWQGERLYYSTNPDVTRAFREEDILVDGICPVSGAELDTVSYVERRLLPSDVDIDRRLYHGPEGLYRHVILLITGESREGIHRPEWCLNAQGVGTGERFLVAVRDEADQTFYVAAYPMIPPQAPEGYQPNRYFVYWFEGPTTKTPHNFTRILRMGWDRLRSGRVQRWAYFSIQLNVTRTAQDPTTPITEAVEALMQARRL